MHILRLILIPFFIFFSGILTDDIFAETDIASRVISLSPAVTEIIYALGKEDSLIGVTSFCDYPPQAKEKTVVGGIVNANLEEIIALKPDCVFYIPSMSNMNDRLELLGTRKVPILSDTISDIFKAVATIGEVMGAQEKSKELVRSMEKVIKKIQEVSKDLPKAKTLFIISRDPYRLKDMYAVSGGFYLHELLEITGGENIFRDIGRKHIRISAESIVSRDPEVILDFNHEYLSLSQENKDLSIRIWDQLPMVSAVRAKRVHALWDDHFVRPGPRIVKAAKELFGIFHPDKKDLIDE